MRSALNAGTKMSLYSLQLTG